MKRILSAVLMLALAVSATAWQKPQAPTFPGDGDPRHDGQPIQCQNHSNGRYAKNCSCKSMNSDGETCSDQQESRSCKVYCRKDACRCISPCQT